MMRKGSKGMVEERHPTSWSAQFSVSAGTFWSSDVSKFPEKRNWIAVGALVRRWIPESVIDGGQLACPLLALLSLRRGEPLGHKQILTKALLIIASVTALRKKTVDELVAQESLVIVRTNITANTCLWSGNGFSKDSRVA